MDKVKIYGEIRKVLDLCQSNCLGQSVIQPFAASQNGPVKIVSMGMVGYQLEQAAHKIEDIIRKASA